MAAARSSGCRAAELFAKEGRGRQLTLEPSSPGEASRRIASWTRESGAALRIVDRSGRAGFAWTGLGDAVEPKTLVDAALLAAEPAALIPLAGFPGAWSAGAPRWVTHGVDLGLVDPACLRAKDDDLFDRMQEGFDEVARSGEGMLEVDRLAIGEVATTIRLANSDGVRGLFDRTLAFASIALVPAAPEARAVVEERVSCRVTDLDIADGARDAVLRALPERAADPAEAFAAAAAVDLVLAPRAAASLIAALVPAATSGGLPEIRRPSALTLSDDPTLAGRPSSAPFDGAGRPVRTHLLVEGGRSVGRIDAAGPHLQRPSYRDLPTAGPAALVVAPSVKVADQASGGDVRTGIVLLVRAAIVDIVPGPEWTLRVRRGEISMGGAPLGPADGLVCQGGLDRLLQAFTETGADSCWYQSGVAIRTPSVTLRGLTSWRWERGQR